MKNKFLILLDKDYIENAINIDQVSWVEEDFDQEKCCPSGAMIYLKDRKEIFYSKSSFDDLVEQLDCGVVYYGERNENGSDSYEFLVVTEEDPCVRYIIRTGDIIRIEDSGERCIVHTVSDSHSHDGEKKKVYSYMVVEAYFSQFIKFFPHRATPIEELEDKAMKNLKSSHDRELGDKANDILSAIDML